MEPRELEQQSLEHSRQKSSNFTTAMRNGAAHILQRTRTRGCRGKGRSFVSLFSRSRRQKHDVDETSTDRWCYGKYGIALAGSRPFALAARPHRCSKGRREPGLGQHGEQELG